MPIHRHINTGAVFADRLRDLADLRRRYTIGGTPTITASPFGNALTFGGAADYIDIDDEEYNLRFDSGAQDFSVAVWVKTSTAGLQIILDKRDAENDGWVLFLDASNYAAFSLDAVDIVGATDVADDEWHHVACVIDRSGNGQMYLDGAADGAAVAVGDEVMATTTTPRIGAVSYGAASYFNGLMRDLLVYDRILTAEEVLDLATNRSF